MPKPAIFSGAAGQRASVAAFMLLLLACVTGLAYAATWQPNLTVRTAGLSVSLPADWRKIEPTAEQAAAAPFRVNLVNERRPALRAVVQRLRVVDEDAMPVRSDASSLLRMWFPPLILATMPDPNNIETTRVGELEVAHWTGVLQSRVPIFNQSPLSVVGVALVLADDGRMWSVVMRDDNYRHEDPAERVQEHRERLQDALATLRRVPDAETQG
jgi:hypothetical protein